MIMNFDHMFHIIRSVAKILSRSFKNKFFIDRKHGRKMRNVIRLIDREGRARLRLRIVKKFRRATWQS